MPMAPQTDGEPALVLQTVQQAVLGHLRNLILSQQLLPGERLVQDELARRLGVSRTPVREALHRLAQEGLVTISSYRGASVAGFSLSDLKGIYAVRSALESHATYLAAQCISDEELEQLSALLQEMEAAFRKGDFECLLAVHHRFHARIYAAAGEQRLYDLTVQHLELCGLYQRMALSLGRGATDPVVEHQEILATLQRREAEAAGRLMRSHLHLTAVELLELFERVQSHAGAEASRQPAE